MEQYVVRWEAFMRKFLRSLQKLDHSGASLVRIDQASTNMTYPDLTPTGGISYAKASQIRVFAGSSFRDH